MKRLLTKRLRPVSNRPTKSNFKMNSRNCIESTFTASDGQVIFYRAWKPRSNDSGNAVLLFHRGHEHSARWQDFVDTSSMDDCWFFAWDARGHGKTEGKRGAADSFARMVLDAQEFSEHLCETYNLSISDFGVVGQSVGAVLAATWIHDYCPPVRAMVLATPALRIRLYVPLAIPSLRVLRKIRPQSFIKSYVRPGMLTHDAAEANSYANDPLVSPQIAVNILLDLHDTSTRLIDDAAAIHTPTLMLVSGKDYVVRQDVQHQFFSNLSSSDKEIDVLQNFHHSTFWEQDRGPVIRRSAQFLRERFETETRKPESHQLAKASEFVYQSLKSPPGLLKQALFKMQTVGLSTVGRLSRGVQIGWKSGFDSGQSLDHVYGNQSKGMTPVGKLIDRGYLDSIGWKGIRQRKVHLEQVLDQAIEKTLKQNERITIMDIAAGPGRYVLETLKRHSGKPIQAILCDRDPGGIAEGKVIAKELGIEEQVRFCESDAFDPDKIAQAANGTPINIAIASGLYELFPENEMIQRSLQGISAVLDDQGQLLYTDQPWHPQQEMIARVLPNRDGDPWVMRCRSQAEMDSLVESIGLSRRQLLIDQWGIFSVALAARSEKDDRTQIPRNECGKLQNRLSERCSAV